MSEKPEPPQAGYAGAGLQGVWYGKSTAKVVLVGSGLGQETKEHAAFSSSHA